MFIRTLFLGLALLFTFGFQNAVAEETCKIEVQVSGLVVTVGDCTNLSCYVELDTRLTTHFAPSVLCPISETYLNNNKFLIRASENLKPGEYEFEGVLVFDRGSFSIIDEFDGSLVPVE